MQDDQDNGEFPVSDNPESNQTSYDDEADARDSRTFQVADHGIAMSPVPPAPARPAHAAWARRSRRSTSCVTWARMPASWAGATSSDSIPITPPNRPGSTGSTTSTPTSLPPRERFRCCPTALGLLCAPHMTSSPIYPAGCGRHRPRRPAAPGFAFLDARRHGSRQRPPSGAATHASQRRPRRRDRDSPETNCRHRWRGRGPGHRDPVGRRWPRRGTRREEPGPRWARGFVGTQWVSFRHRAVVVADARGLRPLLPPRRNLHRTTSGSA